MPQRMEIELTSRVADGGWTWRAVGARQPRGVLAAGLVPEGSEPGSVLRAEVESGLEGIEVVAVQPRLEASAEPTAERIEVLGPSRRPPDVSVSLASGSRRRRETDRPERKRRRERRDGPAAGPDGPEERAGRRHGGRPGPAGERGRRDTRDHRPAISMTHRNAALAELRPEELPVAEQLLRGGLPAVREAIDDQNRRAREDGRPTVAADPLMATAERLLPVINLATWKDRASSAQAAGREVRLRELRAVVTASRTVALDPEGRTMAKSLQEALDQRVSALREEWLGRVTKALENGRAVDALAVAGQPPEPSARLPAELAVTLAEEAGRALNAELAVEDWTALLAAVVESPVRRSVRPAGIPEDPQARAAAMRAAGSVPALARQLGLPVPPPPPRRGPVRDRPGARRPGSRRAG